MSDGAEVQKIYFAGVNVGALSLSARARPRRVLSALGPKSVHMVFLRAVEAGKITAAWKEGFEANLTLAANRSAGGSRPETERPRPSRLPAGGAGTVVWIDDEHGARGL